MAFKARSLDDLIKGVNVKQGEGSIIEHWGIPTLRGWEEEGEPAKPEKRPPMTEKENFKKWYLEIR